MQAFKIRPALAVDLIEKIRAFDIDSFDYDSATQLQGVRVRYFDHRIGAFDGCYELSSPVSVDFQITEMSGLCVPAKAQASDFNSRPIFAESGFYFFDYIAVEFFGSDVVPGAQYKYNHEQDCAH